MNTADARLIEFVGRCRRRQLLSFFLQSVSFAAAILFLIAAAVAYGCPGHLMSVLAVAAAAALAFGAGAAWLRAPTLAACADRLDRQYRLQNSVVAALQMRERASPVADLVVRQALQRVSGINPAHAVPIRPGWPAAAAAGALAIAVSATVPGSLAARRASSEGIRVATDGSARRQSDIAPGNERPEQQAGPRNADQPGSSARGATAGAKATLPQERPALPPAQTESLDHTARSDDRAQQVAADADRQGAGRGAGAQSPQGSHVMNERAASAAGRSASTSGNERAQGAARSGDSGGGQGASNMATANTGGAAGGVKDGPLAATGPRADPSAAARSTLKAGRPPATPGADAALIHEEVPPRLRPYVRSYFEAIRP